MKAALSNDFLSQFGLPLPPHMSSIMIIRLEKLWLLSSSFITLFTTLHILVSSHFGKVSIDSDILDPALVVAYTVEILPYRLRAKGLTMKQFCVSASVIFNQYINPIAIDHLSWKVSITQ
jgi:hypothetical protein